MLLTVPHPHRAPVCCSTVRVEAVVTGIVDPALRHHWRSEEQSRDDQEVSGAHVSLLFTRSRDVHQSKRDREVVVGMTVHHSFRSDERPGIVSTFRTNSIPCSIWPGLNSERMASPREEPCACRFRVFAYRNTNAAKSRPVAARFDNVLFAPSRSVLTALPAAPQAPRLACGWLVSCAVPAS